MSMILFSTLRFPLGTCSFVPFRVLPCLFSHFLVPLQGSCLQLCVIRVGLDLPPPPLSYRLNPSTFLTVASFVWF
ncbi:hypothetical protein L596_022465 [Steinernema carpocapsae]|uniref:Secreted protein n=1 Tax=Steinernema carpocapsae TaxID=34508 RepID=A0A4V6A0H6_STECR|nr:hypothetical protein L596_022465 [Steinernema carpocapsae]